MFHVPLFPTRDLHCTGAARRVHWRSRLTGTTTAATAVGWRRGTMLQGVAQDVVPHDETNTPNDTRERRQYCCTHPHTHTPTPTHPHKHQPNIHECECGVAWIQGSQCRRLEGCGCLTGAPTHSAHSSDVRAATRQTRSLEPPSSPPTCPRQALGAVTHAVTHALPRRRSWQHH